MSLVANAIDVALAGRKVLHEASITVQPGALTAVVGPNGSGKSTLLRSLAGDLRVQRGNVTMNGIDLPRWDTRDMARTRAVLTQNVDIAFARSAAEVVLLGRLPHNRGAATAEDHAVVEEAMACAGVSGLRDRCFLRLSGGEKQRVQLARVLAQLGPARASCDRYLLLDEPLAALDPSHQHEVMTLLRRVAAQRIGIAVVLHDLSLAARYADDVVVVDRGRVVAAGPPRRVLEPSLLRDTFGLEGRLLTHRRSGAPFLLVERAVTASAVAGAGPASGSPRSAALERRA